MAEENGRKEAKELRFALCAENKIIFLECLADGTIKPDSPTFDRDYIAKHYNGSKIKAVYTSMPDCQKNELEGIINYREKKD
ncbi:hypothetical protein HYT26_01845 [Candidatus Pacearchaeota archaeon]|nr:hypothetical protein [Candidatus Pacearchaeota archaeon]